jgi:hypothetical protein
MPVRRFASYLVPSCLPTREAPVARRSAEKSESGVFTIPRSGELGSTQVRSGDVVVIYQNKQLTGAVAGTFWSISACGRKCGVRVNAVQAERWTESKSLRDFSVSLYLPFIGRGAKG